MRPSVNSDIFMGAFARDNMICVRKWFGFGALAARSWVVSLLI